MALNLMLHSGGEPVAREALPAVPTPEPTDTWHPIPHADLLAGVSNALTRSGFNIVAEAHATARGGLRYFGMLQCETALPDRDYGLVVGLRNSHDKSFPGGLCVGNGVFVCDNLSFSGEITLARKHTVHIARDLPGLIESAVGRITELRGRQDLRIARYKSSEMPDARAHDLLVQALDARVLCASHIPDVLKQWREPDHPEFAPRNAWSLFNAFTEALKDRSLFALPKATQALHGLLDTACGVLN